MITLTITIKQREDDQLDLLLIPKATLHTEREMLFAKVIQNAIYLTASDLGSKNVDATGDQVAAKIAQLTQVNTNN